MRFFKAVDEALPHVIVFLNYFKKLQVIFLNKNLEQKYNAIMQDDSLDVEESVVQKENITQKFSTTRLDKNNVKKIKNLKKYIEHISICKININSRTTKGIKHDNIVLRFYDKNNKPVVVSGEDSNKITYGSTNFSIDEVLPIVTAFLSYFNTFEIEIVNKDLETKYNALMQDAYSSSKEEEDSDEE
jgi:hypothetical protein